MPAPLSVNVPRIVTVTGQGIVLIQTLKGMIENECNDDDGDDDIWRKTSDFFPTLNLVNLVYKTLENFDDTSKSLIQPLANVYSLNMHYGHFKEQWKSSTETDSFINICNALWRTKITQLCCTITLSVF